MSDFQFWLNLGVQIFVGVVLVLTIKHRNSLIETLKEFSVEKDKYIAAICASPAIVLSKANIEEGKNITSYPGKGFEELLKKATYTENLVEVDGNIITSRGPATAMLFAYKLLDILGYNSKEISNEMLWNLL